MRDFKVLLGNERMVRAGRELTYDITLGEVLDKIRAGTYAKEVSFVRGVKRDSVESVYKTKRRKHVPCIHGLQRDGTIAVIDLEVGKELPAYVKQENILFKFVSVGGVEGDYAVGIRVNDRGTLVALHKAVKSSKGQHSADRCRYMSHDPQLYCNYEAVPLSITSPREEVVPESGDALDNNTALQMYSHLRQTLSVEQARIQMELLSYASVSLASPTMRLEYYQKWEQQYGAEYCGEDKPFTVMKKDKRVVRPAGRQWLKEHVLLIPSMSSPNKFAHVFRTPDNIHEYYESASSMSGSKVSQLLQDRIRKEDSRWENHFPPVENEWLDTFDPSTIQRDDAKSIKLYLLNGEITITRKETIWTPGNDRAPVWKSMITPIVYDPLDKTKHPLHKLILLVDVSPKAFQLKMALGYLLHRHIWMNGSKVVVAVDHEPKNKRDGRRGKDFFLKLVKMFRNSVPLKWKEGHNFWASVIVPGVEVVHGEDMTPTITRDPEFMSVITGDVPVEGKNKGIVTIQAKDKPKFALTMHRLPYDYHSESVKERIWLVEFTDFLQHAKNKPKEDFLMGDSSFVNFMVECSRVYLTHVATFRAVGVLTEEQRKASLVNSWGWDVVETVYKMRDQIKKKKQAPSKLLYETMCCDPTDGKAIQKVRMCYEAAYGVRLLQKFLLKERVYVEDKI